MNGASTNPPEAAHDLALVSGEDRCRLLILKSGELARRVETGFAHVARHAWADDGRLAVLLGRTRSGWREVRILRLDGARLRCELRIPVPLPATDLLWNGEQLFICGHSESTSRAWVIAPSLENPAWRPLPMPDELLRRRKGFDALVLNGNHLVAIDNIVVPKWMVRYRLQPGMPPELDGVAQLASNGTYEHALSAAGGHTRFAVLSTTMGRGGRRAYLCVYAWNDLSLLEKHELGSGVWHYAMQDDDLWLLWSGRHHVVAPSCGPPKSPTHPLQLHRPGVEPAFPQTFASSEIDRGKYQLVRSSRGLVYVVDTACTRVWRAEELVDGRTLPWSCFS